MAESKTRLAQSQIPVKASGSRRTQPAQPVPLPLSSPHLHFASPSQHLSVGDSPVYPSPRHSSAPSSTTGITTFRSIRNLLPFGPTKLPSTSTSSNPATPSSKSGPFSNLGALRRSINGERSVSAPTLRPQTSHEGSPLPSIELSHNVDEPLIRPEDLRGGLGLYMKQPEPPPPPPTSQRFGQSAAVSPPSPTPAGASDLSTIMEAETSGISKSAPNTNDGHVKPPVPLGAPPPAPSSHDNDTSALDLSTSQVTHDVLEALANDRQQAWVHGIVVDDADPPTDVSFHLEDLDPQLAALLSPHRVLPSAVGAADALAVVPPPTAAPSALSHASPARRPAPVSRPTSTPPVPPPDAGERPSSASRRRYSQLQGDAEPEPPRRPTTGGDADPRRPVLSRLMTPVRPALQLTAASGPRSAVRSGSAKTSPSAWDAESVSPSRPPSALGRPSLDGSADRSRTSPLVRTRDRSASVSERPLAYYGAATARPPATEWLGPRTAKAFAAAGLIDERSHAAPGRPASRFGARAQSELDTRSHYAPSSRMAFSDAGSASSWGRRSGSLSRPAMSDINGPMSESASTPRTAFSSTASTALTSVSSTSVHLQSELQAIHDKHALETGALLNALADSQRTSKILRDENTELRDRLHELETRLADAVDEIQRWQYHASVHARSTYPRSSSLRPVDGGAVRRRPSALQTVVHADADDDILLHAPPPSARSSSESRREDHHVPPPHPKRFSNTSSIFPVPPTTMSMLLHEDALAPETYSAHSRSPPSPTATLSSKRASSRHSHGPSYSHRRSASSASTAATAANISPTTANFSMLTGSPGSLSLRPEHEMLLGDMPPLSLSSDDFDFDADDP